MLERASTCLESGGRQLFRAPTPCLCLRSRPAPYASASASASTSTSTSTSTSASAFRPYTVAAASSDPASRDVVDTATAAHSLDFLYPEKTLELLRRLSAASPAANGTAAAAAAPQRPRSLPLTGLRQYSTASRTFPPRTDPEIKAEARREFKDHVRHTTPSKALDQLVRRGKPGRQELAWRLWKAIPDDDMKRVPVGLRCDFVTYALAGEAAPNMERVIQVYNTIPRRRRTPSLHRAIVLAYLHLDEIKLAVKFHDEALMSEYLEDFDFGTDALLRRTLASRQWSQCLRVFQSFLFHKSRLQGDQTVARIRKGDPLIQVWGEAAQLPWLEKRFQNFLHFVRHNELEMRSSQAKSDTLDLFVQSLLPHVVPRILHTSTPDEDAIWKYFANLFDEMQSLKLSLSSCYEHTIKEMLKLPRYRAYTNSSQKVWLLLYRKYRRQFVNSQNLAEHEKPSMNLIKRLISQQALHGNTLRVRQLVQDIRTYYPGQPIPPGILEQCIHFFSKHGEAAQVHEFFEEFRSNYGEQIDLRLMSALVYVQARRVDLGAAIRQFKLIHQDHGLVPDRACWNTLLLAFVRADDLDGALECFNNSLDAGIQPDIYTFGPMLDMCANRGDIEAFEALYSRAKQMYIPLDTDVRARSAYVQVFLSADDPEGAEAIARGMLKSWKAGILRDYPLTHTWNIMIQYYALKGDVTSSRRLYRDMLQNKIPLDNFTYSHLMRSLIEIKQTNAAYKILKTTMPANNHRVLAIHYAIVMTGFLRERQYDLAMEAFERMIGRKVVQTESSRLASIHTVGTIELLKIKDRRRKFRRTYRMRNVSRLVHRMLMLGSGQETAHYQPRTGRFMDAPIQSDIPTTYYGLLIMLYTTRGAYKICRELITKARESRPSDSPNPEPISFLTAIMDVHYRTREFDEVEKCWKLVLAQARRLAKTFHAAIHPEADSNVDATSSIARNRRQILVHPTRIYLRSLATQGDVDSLQQAKRTVDALLADGFVVDNLSWNELVQGLAKGGRVTDAFAICEKHLMPKFPGWRSQNPNYIRNERPGYTWMDLRHYDIERNGLLPRYKTIVVLAKIYAMLRRDERGGIGYNEETHMWLRESLDGVAPMTVKAIHTMPRTHDQLQEKHFHNA